MNNDSGPRITFLGAARTVTGSMHLLETGGGGLLVDCGMFQGRREEAMERNRNLPRQAVAADALVLTHAHIDHCGVIPRLVKDGFSGKIYCTEATADLCRHMLRDSAHIQVMDAKWLNKKFGGEPGWQRIMPLYDENHVDKALALFAPQPYDTPFSPIDGVSVELVEAGHILGSATAVVTVEDGARSARIAFSGDIGRRELPILKDPAPPAGVDYVVMESTYGNRVHGRAGDMLDQLLGAIEATRERGGKVIIPSFALERTQEIVYAINQLIRDGRMKPLPVFLDSPLAISLTDVFRRHPECYDEETQEFDLANGDPFGFGMLTMTESVDDSKALNKLEEPAVIISASGMCEFGRIVHHLRNNIESPKNTVLIVGYQAQHTLGRRLVERRKEVRIFGVSRRVRCEIRVLNSFSAHADRDELLWWADECGERVKRFFCVHGDDDQCDALAGHLAARGRSAHVPREGETVELA